MIWNPSKTDASLTASTDGLTLTKTSNSGTHAKAAGDVAAGTAKQAWEAEIVQAGNVGIGLMTAGELIDGDYLGENATSVSFFNDGWRQSGGSGSSGTGFSAGAFVRIEYDPDTGDTEAFVDDVSIGVVPTSFTGDVFPAVDLRITSDEIVANFAPATRSTGFEIWGADLEEEPEEPLTISSPALSNLIRNVAAVGWAATFAAISLVAIPSVANGGPETLQLQGRAAVGDTFPFEVERVSYGSKPYDGFLTTVDGNGQKWAIKPGPMGMWFEWLGAPVDDFSSATSGPNCIPHFNAYKAWAADNYYGWNAVPQLNFRNFYYFDSQPSLNGGLAYHLYGGNTSMGRRQSAFRMKQGVKGLIVDYYDTYEGVVVPYNNSNSAHGSIIDGILFWHLNHEMDRTAYGFWGRARTVTQNCSFMHCGCGAFQQGDIAGGTGGNNNCFIMRDNEFLYNGDAGLYIDGSDANAGLIGGLHLFYGNGICGERDDCFLGNFRGYYHFEGNNGRGDPGVVWLVPTQSWFKGKIYFCEQPDLADTTVPGTNDRVWSFAGDDAIRLQAWIPPWEPGKTWEIGGEIVGTNYAAHHGLLGFYSEDGGLGLALQGTWWVWGAGIGGFARRYSSGIIDRYGQRVRGGYTATDVVQDYAPGLSNEGITVKVGGGRDWNGNVNVLGWGNQVGGGPFNGFWQIRDLAPWGKPHKYELTSSHNSTFVPGFAGTAFFGSHEISDPDVYAGNLSSLGSFLHIYRLMIGEPGYGVKVTGERNEPTTSTHNLGPRGKGDIIVNTRPNAGSWFMCRVVRGAFDPAGYAYERLVWGSPAVLVVGQSDTPAQFTFTNPVNQNRNALVTSNPITVTGSNQSVVAKVQNGQMSINGGAWTSTDTTVSAGNTIAVRHTTSPIYEGVVETQLTLGSWMSGVFRSTTLVDPVTDIHLSDRLKGPAINLTGAYTAERNGTSGGNYQIVMATQDMPTTGKWTWAARPTNTPVNWGSGLCVISHPLADIQFPGFTSAAVAYWADGYFGFADGWPPVPSKISEDSLTAITDDDWVQFFWDADAKKLWTRHESDTGYNGGVFTSSDPATGVGGFHLADLGRDGLRPFASLNHGDAAEFNFGGTSLPFAVTGFTALDQA